MENRELIERILYKLDEITGRSGAIEPGGLEEVILRRLEQTEKIVKAIQRYLPKRVTDKILLNPDGVRVEGERRPVTILFGDLSGFTAMSETMDPEQVVEVINQYFDRMVEIAERYGGHIDKFMGDALMVLFGAPVAHEDDALRACLAAIEMQEAMQQFNREQRTGINLAMSIGINSGEVVAVNVGSKSRMEYTVIGDNVNLASRLEGVAQANETVIGENTYRQVKGRVRLKKLPPVKVKGKAKPQNVYLILGRLDAEGRTAGLRAGSVKLVGRMSEMEAMKQAVAAARSGQGRVVAITGEPGIGKSRLAKELEILARDQGFRFAKGKCYSYAASAAYLPFIRLLRTLLEIGERDGAQQIQEKIQTRLRAWDLNDFEPFLGSLLGRHYPEVEELDPEKRKRKTFEGFRLVFDRISVQQPLALAFEDLQWGDSLSLELLDQIVETVAGKSILICCDYRPELALPFIGRPHCLSLVLNRLDIREVHRLTAELAEVAEVADEVLHKIIERTEGNPLFIEEVVKHLLAKRLVRRQNQILVPGKRFGQMSLPATVAGVVLGRIDRLPEEQRKLLQYAAVVGKEFDRQILLEISKLPADQVQNSLDSLEHFEGLLYGKQTEGRKVYEFNSTTTYETAYGTLLKARRLELHGRVGQTIEMTYQHNLEPHLEDLAHHYYHSPFMDKAVRYLYLTGNKARMLFANEEAIGYYQRGVEVFKKIKAKPEDQTQIMDILLNLGSVYRLVGQPDKALTVYKKAGAIANKYKLSALKLKANIDIAIIYDMMGQPLKSLHLIEMVYNQARRIGDEEIKAYALNNRGHLNLRFGKPDKAMEDFQAAYEIYQVLKNVKQMAQVSCNLGQLQEALGRFDRARDMYKRAIDLAQSINFLEGLALYKRQISNPYMAMGEFEEALRQLQESLTLAAKIGDIRTEGIAHGSLGNIEYLMGNYSQAMASYTKALQAAEEQRDRQQVLLNTINIGCIHQVWGEINKAVEMHLKALALCQQLHDSGSEMEIRRNLGIEYGLLGRADEALEQLERALEMAREMGDPRMAAYVKVGLGTIRCLRGEGTEGDRLMTEALAEAKTVGDPEVVLAALRALYDRPSDEGRSEKTREYIEQAIRIASEINNKREKGYALVSRAHKAEGYDIEGKLGEIHEIAMETGDKILLGRYYLLAAQNRGEAGAYPEAEKYLDDASALIEKIGSPQLRRDFLMQKGRLYEKQGLTDLAQQYYREAGQ